MKGKHVFIFATILGLLTGNLISSVLAQPGTNTDPLVSKSYVDDKINQLFSLISQSQWQSQGSSQTQGQPPVMPTTSEDIVNEALSRLEETNKFVPVNVPAGKLLVGGEGTEIVLRSGRAVGYCGGINGILNATDGTEIMNGTELKINNLMIVPRGDGRGAVAVTDSWFIVRGNYSIAQ